MNNIDPESYIRSLIPDIKDLDLEYISAVFRREVDGYRDFKRRKPNGRTRSISIPDQLLLKVQSEIYSHLNKAIGSKKARDNHIDPSSHAYEKGKSNVTAAHEHPGTKWAIKMDISSFFDNITEEHVLKSLQRLYPASEAQIISLICTRYPADGFSQSPRKLRRFSQKLRPEFLGDTRLPPKKLKRWYLHSAPLERIDPADNSSGSWKKDADKNALMIESRMKNRRKSIFSILSRDFVGDKIRDPRQNLYPVRPSQTRLRVRQGYLPQGSPTSGLLANMVMLSFDRKLARYCEAKSLRYTRYSDDIYISSARNNFSKSQALQIISFVQQLCEVQGFTLNKEKTKIQTPGSRKFMLGLLVDGPKPRLTSQDKERIKHSIWCLATQGYSWTSPLGNRNPLNETHFLLDKRVGSYTNPEYPSGNFESLLGWLAYCKSADQVFLRKLLIDVRRDKWTFIEKYQKLFLIRTISNLLKEQGDEKPKISNSPLHVKRSIEEIL